jgi:hypothetical protein
MIRRFTNQLQQFLTLVKTRLFKSSFSLALRNHKRQRYLLLTGLILATTFVSLFSVPVAQAAGEKSFIADKVKDSMTAHQYYYALVGCFAKMDMDSVTQTELANWEWLKGGGSNAVVSDATFTTLGASSSSPFACARSLKDAFNALGFTDALDTFCQLGFTFSKNNGGNGKSGKGGQSTQACKDGRGQGDFDGAGSGPGAALAQATAVEKLLVKTPQGAAAKKSLSGAEEYVRQYLSFVNTCKPTIVREYGSGAGASGNKKAFKISIVAQDGSVKDYYATTSSTEDNTKVSMVSKRDGSESTSTCGKVAQEIVKNARAYAAWLSDPRNAGATGSSAQGNDTPPEETVTCAIDGIGWVICPVINFLGNITDQTYKILSEDLLEVDASMFDRDTESGKAAYSAWSSVLNVANISFIIAFLFIIYSQITGFGISNYGIKKLLPKFVIAAILVNSSFWICAIAVDLSNIAGNSVKTLLGGQVSGIEFNFSQDGITQTGNSWTALAVAILSAGSLVYVGLSVLLPSLVIVLLALVTVVAVLALRQALIILLIVIAPLAFVAWLLPNTEDWFKKWLSLFKTLLLMFPIIGLVFGASSLASKIVMASSNTLIVQLIGALITAVPLFVTPIIMKTAGGLLGRFGGIINNPNKGPFDRMRKSADSYRDKRQNIAKSRRLNGTSMFGNPGSSLRNSDSRFKRGVGQVLGAPTAVSSGLAGRTLTKERQAASAKASAEFAEQNYVATRASNDASGYAQKIAGPTGSASLAQAYAIEALEKEKAKDRAAEKTIFEHNGTSFQDLGKGIKEGNYSGAREEAALQRYFETANSAGVQEMLEHVNTKRNNPSLTGEDLNRAKEISKITGDALANSPLKPKNLSASNLNKLRNGDGIQDEAARIASTISEGKINASSVGQMDIDEIRKWTGNMVKNTELLKNTSPDKIQATYNAIVEAENDPRINVNLGDREKTGLKDLKKQLEAQWLSSQVKNDQQNAAASTYGPKI